MESKGDEKGSKAEASVKQFGANTPTVSCTFDRELIKDRDFRNIFFCYQNIHFIKVEPDFSCRILRIPLESLCLPGQKPYFSGQRQLLRYYSSCDIADMSFNYL